MKGWLKAAPWALSTLILCVACGGGGGGGGTTGLTSGATSGSTSGSTGGGLMDADQRQASIAQVQQKYVQFAPRSHPENRNAFIASVLSDPNFTDAGWSVKGDNFFAVFKDGVPFAILDNVEPEPNPAVATPAAPTRAAQLPINVSAHVFFSLGNAFQNHTANMQAMLKNAGYSVTVGDAQLDDLLKNIKGDGVFYWNTHSGFFDKGTPKAKAVITTMTESSPAKEKADANLRAMIASGEVGLAGATTDYKPNPTDENHDGTIDHEELLVMKVVYAITPKFIENHMKFAPGSVVFQSSCTSGDPEFVTAFHKAGASVYFGWDSVARPGAQMPLLADKLLGANVYSPKPNPPLRPFDHEAVLTWMAANGLDYDGSGAHVRAYVNTGASSAILKPSIQRMAMEENTGRLIIRGSFGTPAAEDRRVTINGTEVPVVTWAADEIKCALPTSGPNSSGEVKVGVRGADALAGLTYRESNPVMLTEWTGTLKIKDRTSGAAAGSGGSGAVEVNGTLLLKFRADVHSYRDKPDQTPIQPTNAAFMSKEDSTLSYVASGTVTISGGDAVSTQTYSGSGTIAHGFNPAPIDEFFAAGSINLPNHQVKLRLNFYKDVAFNSHNALTQDGHTTSEDVEMPWTLDTSFHPFNSDITMTLNSDFTIAAGQVSTIGTFAPDSGYIITWQPFQVKNVPSPTTPRAR